MEFEDIQNVRVVVEGPKKKQPTRPATSDGRINAKIEWSKEL